MAESYHRYGEVRKIQRSALVCSRLVGHGYFRPQYFSNVYTELLTEVIDNLLRQLLANICLCCSCRGSNVWAH